MGCRRNIRRGHHVDKNVAIYGGFVGGPSGETYRNERDWVANPTVLDGTDSVSSEQQRVSVIRIGAASTPVTRVDGFTVRNGVSEEWDPDEKLFAGGLVCRAGTTLIADNTFLSNSGDSGGAIHCRDCAAVVWNNTFGSPDDVDFDHANGEGEGAAAYFFGCDPGSLICDNTARYDGGESVFCVYWNSADVVNNMVSDCRRWGGYVLRPTGGHIQNNNISDCWAGIWSDGSSPDITGNVIEYTTAEMVDNVGAIQACAEHFSNSGQHCALRSRGRHVRSRWRPHHREKHTL